MSREFFMKTKSNQKEEHSDQPSGQGIHQECWRFRFNFMFFSFTSSRWVPLHKLFWSLLSSALELLQLVSTSSASKPLSREVTPV